MTLAAFMRTTTRNHSPRRCQHCDQPSNVPPLASSTAPTSYYELDSVHVHHHQNSLPSWHQYDEPMQQLPPIALAPSELAQLGLVAQGSRLDQWWTSFMRESGCFEDYKSSRLNDIRPQGILSASNRSCTSNVLWRVGQHCLLPLPSNAVVWHTETVGSGSQSPCKINALVYHTEPPHISPIRLLFRALFLANPSFGSLLNLSVAPNRRLREKEKGQQ